MISRWTIIRSMTLVIDTKTCFEDFDDALSGKNQNQIIEFPTWSRIVNNVLGTIH